MLPAGKVALSTQPLGFSADSVGQTENVERFEKGIKTVWPFSGLASEGDSLLSLVWVVSDHLQS